MSANSETTADKQPEGRKGFAPGVSGNPSGRPPGSRNKATLAVEALLEGEAEALTRRCIERALEGDGQALRLCLDRLAPPRRDRPVSFALPALKEAADARDALAAVVRAVAEGELTPSEGATLAGLIEQFARVDDATESYRRIRDNKSKKGPLSFLDF
jgi:hypothetical protein